MIELQEILTLIESAQHEIHSEYKCPYKTPRIPDSEIQRITMRIHMLNAEVKSLLYQAQIESSKIFSVSAKEICSSAVKSAIATCRIKDARTRGITIALTIIAQVAGDRCSAYFTCRDYTKRAEVISREIDGLEKYLWENLWGNINFN